MTNCPTCKGRVCEYCFMTMHQGGMGQPHYCDTDYCPNSYYGKSGPPEEIIEHRKHKVEIIDPNLTWDSEKGEFVDRRNKWNS